MVYRECIVSKWLRENGYVMVVSPVETKKGWEFAAFLTSPHHPGQKAWPEIHPIAEVAMRHLYGRITAELIAGEAVTV